jgi:hypothetical protein
VSQAEKAAIEKSIADLQVIVGGIDLNQYVTNKAFEERVSAIEEAVTWGEMSET